MNLGFFLSVLDLKDEPRAAAQMLGVEDCETVAGHSWNVAFLILVFSSERDVDLEKTLKMALVHDLAEYSTGDLVDKGKYDGAEVSKEEKENMEEKAWGKISEGIDVSLKNLWEEYNRRETRESRFVKEMDMIDLGLQVVKYKHEESFTPSKVRKLPDNFVDKIFENSEEELKTEHGEELFRKVKSQYQKLKAEGRIDWKDQKISQCYKILSLKDQKRTGQQLYNIENPDSIAAHLWTVSILTMIYADKVDVENALKMAVVHDIGESKIGDFSDRADKENRKITEEDKEKRERQAIQQISENLNQPNIRKLWEKFENPDTPEAKLVTDLDSIESSLQALHKEKNNRYKPRDNKDKNYEHLDEFFLTTTGNLETQKAQQLFNKIQKKYQEAKQH